VLKAITNCLIVVVGYMIAIAAMTRNTRRLSSESKAVSERGQVGQVSSSGFMNSFAFDQGFLSIFQTYEQVCLSFFMSFFNVAIELSSESRFCEKKMQTGIFHSLLTALLKILAYVFFLRLAFLNQPADVKSRIQEA
jgi:hypothetical protein